MVEAGAGTGLDIPASEGIMSDGEPVRHCKLETEAEVEVETEIELELELDGIWSFWRNSKGIRGGLDSCKCFFLNALTFGVGLSAVLCVGTTTDSLWCSV